MLSVEGSWMSSIPSIGLGGEALTSWAICDLVIALDFFLLVSVVFDGPPIVQGDGGLGGLNPPFLTI